MSVFITAYRKAYSANDVLIRCIENWKQLDNHKYVGIAKTIVYWFTKSFCLTLNERDVFSNNCCATINVRDSFPIKSRSLHCDLHGFFCAQHFLRLRYLQREDALFIYPISLKKSFLHLIPVCGWQVKLLSAMCFLVFEWAY